MVYEFGFGLPDDSFAKGIAWCQVIVDKLGVDKDESGLADFLANEMLVIVAPDRSTAKACRQAALDAGLTSELRPANDDGTDKSTCGNPEAVPAGGRSSSLSSLAPETVRHHRPGAPEPSMAAQTGKRRRPQASDPSPPASDLRQNKRHLAKGNADVLPCQLAAG